MSTTDSTTVEPMNWADYWDSLSDEYFLLRARAQGVPEKNAERMHEREAFVEKLHDMARDLT